MYLVSELLREKGSTVHTIPVQASVLDAARVMNQYRIGAVVVTGGTDRGRQGEAGEAGVVGIFTERDILMRVVAECRDPATTRVEEVMTPRVLTCTPETSIDELRKVMREKRVRHIPVMDGGKLAGMVSIGDVNAAEEQQLVETITYLEAYITQ